MFHLHFGLACFILNKHNNNRSIHRWIPTGCITRSVRTRCIRRWVKDLFLSRDRKIKRVFLFRCHLWWQDLWNGIVHSLGIDSLVVSRSILQRTSRTRSIPVDRSIVVDRLLTHRSGNEEVSRRIGFLRRWKSLCLVPIDCQRSHSTRDRLHRIHSFEINCYLPCP